MEFEVRVSREPGIVVGQTYLEASTQQELIAAIRALADDAESGEMDWLEGAFDE